MLKLERPDLNLLPSYFDFIEEMRANGETVWAGMLPKEGQSDRDFVAEQLARESIPFPGLVKDTIYWAVESGQVIGRISIRHELNDALKEFGGHIGYEVRPGQRRRGFAKEMLAQILKTQKALEIRWLLLTCDPTNIGSIRTILSNGGVFEKTAFVQRVNRDTNYYWIEAAPPAQ